jgi:hypothetical protein
MIRRNQATGLLCVPGSQENELFDHFDKSGKWVRHINDADLPRVATGKAEMLAGPAGSITIHNCRTVHASEPNLSPRGRPLLLNTYSAGETFPYTPNPIPSPHSGEIIRGERPKWVNHDPCPCMVPPDWSGGYGSIFSQQASRRCDPPVVQPAICLRRLNEDMSLRARSLSVASRVATPCAPG